MPTMTPAMPRMLAAWRGARSIVLTLAAAGLAACAGARVGEAPTTPTPRPGAPAAVSLPVPPPPLQREFRGVWIATVNNIDWPTRRTLPVDSMKAELLALIDRAAQLHFNAIVFQVRPAADALYKSRIEPWSPFLTGAMGLAPPGDFDPLAFVVREAHARGMQVHAWFNPYRAGFASKSWVPTSEHVSQKHPEWVKPYGSFYWMDPGIPDVRAYALSVVKDVVQRYDVDGVHIDDYFYPYVERDSATKKPIPFPDDDSYNAYRMAGGTLDLGDWRRENVNKLIRGMDEEVHALKPWVLVGVSPIGVYRPGEPQGARFDAYSEIYCDSRKWLNEGWVDYYVPQVYYLTRQATSTPYAPALAWWAAENTQGRLLFAGNFTTRVGGRDTAWTVDELVEQIKLTRAQKGAGGNVHFSARFLYGTTPIAEALRTGPYAELALVPPAPWLGRERPAAPQVSIAEEGDQPTVTFTPGDAVQVRFWVVRYYDGTRWFTDVLGHETTRYALPAGLERPFYVAVSAIGPNGMEGALGTARSGR